MLQGVCRMTIFYQKFRRCSTPQYNNNLQHSERCKYSLHETNVQTKCITICFSQVALAHMLLFFYFFNAFSFFLGLACFKIIKNIDLKQLIQTKNGIISFVDDSIPYMTANNITNLVEL